MTGLFRETVKSEKRNVLKFITECTESQSRLKDKNSDYYREHEALIQAYKLIYAIWANAEKTFKEE